MTILLLSLVANMMMVDYSIMDFRPKIKKEELISIQIH